MRVLVFGDSITQGYWAIEHGWVDRVRMYYDARQREDLENRDEPTVFNLGISADNSQDILDRVVSEVTARTRESHSIRPIIVIQIGINDGSVLHGAVQVDIGKYEQNLREIVNILKPLTSRVVFVGSSACDEARTRPVFWNEYHYMNQTIKEYEAAMGKVADELGIDFIPIYEQFKAVLDKGEDLLPDGLHPNDAGHELIYQIVKPKLVECLK